MRARILILLFVLLAGVVHAAGPRAVREQAEMSMLVTGMVLIDPEGRVTGWQIDQREKLPDYAANLVERSAPMWKFEPVLIDGQPRAMKARMSLRLVAEKQSDGDFRIAIGNGYFGRDALSEKERTALDRDGDSDAGQAADSLRAIAMRPPGYPDTALQMGARGTVYLIVRVGRDGAVEDVAVEQVNLRVVGNENQMQRIRDMLSKPAAAAARRWTFRVPTVGESADQEYWLARVPVDYKFAGEKYQYGQWQAYIPGPYQRHPWQDDDADASRGPDALADGGIYEVGKGLKLLTPLQEG
ncbi:MAG TPA: protein tonB [Luteimonas sp.]|nr:protein tonB [Luteimonas sp.]HRO27498.1 protein tonB [Luteimonas sp.]HRP73285.1 protein tonB [Luteimonas sp.]